jgi:general secretion pathway protein I
MRNAKGFTLIEVLVALFILTGGIIVLANAWSGNFMRIRKSALFNDVSTLLERKMAETEAKYRNKYAEIPEDDTGEFDTEHPEYTWKLKSRELKLPDITPLLLGQEDHPDETLVSMIKQLSEQLSKAIKEVKISVLVKRGGRQLEFSATEYFVDYQGNFDLGGAGGAAPGGTKK